MYAGNSHTTDPKPRRHVRPPHQSCTAIARYVPGNSQESIKFQVYYCVRFWQYLDQFRPPAQKLLHNITMPDDRPTTTTWVQEVSCVCLWAPLRPQEFRQFTNRFRVYDYFINWIDTCRRGNWPPPEEDESMMWWCSGGPNEPQTQQ